MTSDLTRRRFIEQAAAIGGAVGLGRLWAGEPAASEPQPLEADRRSRRAFTPDASSGCTIPR